MELYDYQEKGRNFLLTRKYALLGDEMGLGKTIQAIAAIPNNVGPVLVVCPAMLRYTWAREIEKYQDEFHRFDFDIEVEARKFQLSPPRNTIRIVSYEGLQKLPRTFLPRVLIFDEAHYLKSLQAKRTQAAHELVFRAAPEYVWLLSGTPIKNNVTEFYSALKILSYCPYGTNGLKVTEKSQYAFNMRFSNPSKRSIYVGSGRNKRHVEIVEYKGIRNLEKLKEYLAGKYLRRLAKSVLDLPELIDKDVMFSERNGASDKELLEAFENKNLFSDGHVSTIKANSALDKVPKTTKYIIDLVEQNECVVVF
jgi:SNF2 family DNA or RNA helicase